MNIHWFISEKHVTYTWKKEFVGLFFRIPVQADMDKVTIEASKLILSNDHIKIPVALAPLRGRPSRMQASDSCCGMNGAISEREAKLQLFTM